MATSDGSALATWLLEQIAEDERDARKAQIDGGKTWALKRRGPSLSDALAYENGVAVITGAESALPHAARWDPARVLAECDAKRRIVDIHTPEDRYLDCPTCTDRDYRTRRYDDNKQLWWCDTLKLLALPYADRPGYREEWKP